MQTKVFAQLSKKYNCEFDDRGNIGKRYRRQDEIGTPFCVTYDFESETDGAVTVRDRDTMEQERIKIEDGSLFRRKAGYIFCRKIHLKIENTKILTKQSGLISKKQKEPCGL